jgi:hypothetical protein
MLMVHRNCLVAGDFGELVHHVRHTLQARRREEDADDLRSYGAWLPSISASNSCTTAGDRKTIRGREFASADPTAGAQDATFQGHPLCAEIPLCPQAFDIRGGIDLSMALRAKCRSCSILHRHVERRTRFDIQAPSREALQKGPRQASAPAGRSGPDDEGDDDEGDDHQRARLTI